MEEVLSVSSAELGQAFGFKYLVHHWSWHVKLPTEFFYCYKMVLDVITSSSFGPAAEVLSQIIEALIDAVIQAKDVSIEKKSFAELASYLDRIVPLLRELNKKNIGDSDGFSNFVESLNHQTKLAKQLITECSKKNKVYLLMNCRSIMKRLEDITREISWVLSLIPLFSLDVSSSILEEIDRLCESMRSVEFKTALAEEEILEKIESGIHDRKVDRSYANKVVLSIAEALGISTDRSTLKKEFEEFKGEIENAKLRKDQAEAIQLDQIIALLERADATSTPEERERKYLTKRNSLGSQPLEPLQSFYCPITKEVMVDPVETSSGHTFERSAIEKWLADGSNLCPLTATPLESSTLRPNKTLRQSIEEWKDRNTMIMIASMKPKLSLENEEEVLHCLEKLQDLCEQRDQHQEWIMLDNYIPILVELLVAKNRDIRNHALVTLCILAKDSDDAKDRIARVDIAIESIVRSLGRPVGQKLAVALLLELSNHEAVRDCIGKVRGCIMLLVTMSNNNDDIQAATDARDLLENLSFSDQNVIQMAKANYFKYLLIRLSSGAEDIKMIMVTTLAGMELTDHNKSSLVEEGVLESLCSMLSNSDVGMKEMAAKALFNLSSLPLNGWQMIRKGSVGPLLNLLYHHMSTPSLREHVAATIMHLAISTTAQNSNGTPVSLFESDEETESLFVFACTCTEATVQESLLRALHAMCYSPSATIVKAKLKQSSDDLKALVQLFEVDNLKVRARAVKLFYCLTDASEKTTILEHLNKNSIETFIRITKSSTDEEEIASAMGIIANLPESPELIKWLLEAQGLLVILSHLHDGKHNGSHKNELVENAVGSICHFTAPTNQLSQKRAAEAGVIPLLVQLLDLGTSLTKRRASISLAQFSKSSLGLSRAIAKPLGFWCFSATPASGCPVHQGICTVESSFCLLKANAVSPLVRLLGEPDPDTCEASLDALLTLIEGVQLQSGGKVLSEANGISPIIKLLGTTSPNLQEKVLNSLERIFRLVEFKQKYGMSAHMPLVDLTQRGNSRTKSLAARILAQLNVLPELSSYF